MRTTSIKREHKEEELVSLGVSVTVFSSLGAESQDTLAQNAPTFPDHPLKGQYQPHLRDTDPEKEWTWSPLSGYQVCAPVLLWTTAAIP